MKACTLPSGIWPLATRRQPMSVVGVAEQEHRRLDESGDELGLGGGSTKLLVAFVEFLGNGLGAA